MVNQLEVIVKESGLDQTKSDFILNKFQDYFKLSSEWEVKAKNIIVSDDSQTAEMKQARIGRLFLREKRISIENSRKELKEQCLREGKAIDGIANVLKALIIPIEEYLEKQEKFVEIKEAKRAEEARLLGEKILEEQRIEKEKLELIERNKVLQENERFKKEADEREKQIKAEREEQERIQKERELKLKKEADEKIRVEREAKEKLELEIKQKKDKEEEEKLNEKNKQEMLKNADDKTKLIKLADDLMLIALPTVTSSESIALVEKIKVLLTVTLQEKLRK